MAAGPARLAVDQVSTLVALLAVAVAALGFGLNIGFARLPRQCAATALPAVECRRRPEDRLGRRVARVRHRHLRRRVAAPRHRRGGGHGIAALGSPLLDALLLCAVGAITSAFASSAGILGAMIPLAVPLLAQGDWAPRDWSWRWRSRPRSWTRRRSRRSARSRSRTPGKRSFHWSTGPAGLGGRHGGDGAAAHLALFIFVQTCCTVRECRMKITLLGTGTPAPSLEPPSSGYLIEVGGDLIVMDHGPGAHPAARERAPRGGRHPRVLHAPALRPLHGLRAARAPAMGPGRGPDSRPAGVRAAADPAHDRAALRRGRRVRSRHPRPHRAPEQHRRLRARGGSVPRKRPAPQVRKCTPATWSRANGWKVTVGRATHVQPLPRVPRLPARRRRRLGMLHRRQRRVRRDRGAGARLRRADPHEPLLQRHRAVLLPIARRAAITGTTRSSRSAPA